MGRDDPAIARRYPNCTVRLGLSGRPPATSPGMRQTFVVVSIVAGLLLWVVAIVNAEPAKRRLVVLQASPAWCATSGRQ